MNTTKINKQNIVNYNFAITFDNIDQKFNFLKQFYLIDNIKLSINYTTNLNAIINICTIEQNINLIYNCCKDNNIKIVNN